MQVRWLAVHMLLAFMGAAMGWAYSWRAFVNNALLAYMAGVSAQDLMDQVSQQEFSQAGTMFKAAASATIQSEKINAEAFSRCAPLPLPAFPWKSQRSRLFLPEYEPRVAKQRFYCWHESMRAP